MDIIPSLIAVDWGTTNRRVFLLDSAGRLVREEQDDAGVAALGRKGVYDAVALLRARFPQQLI
ncbi:MAG: 2-keto-3-deoxy-galactonokinase, partial [Pseudomonadota bacterium]